MIRAIIFDCYGVLYRDAASELLDRCDPADQGEVENALTAYRYGYRSPSELAHEVAPLVGESSAQVLAWLQCGMLQNEQLLQAIRALHGTYSIALMSNSSRVGMDAIISPEQQAGLFDGEYLSGEVGVEKPGRGIYTYAVDDLGVRADECVLIDDAAGNVAGAKEVGMHAVLFTGNRELSRDLLTLGIKL